MKNISVILISLFLLTGINPSINAQNKSKNATKDQFEVKVDGLGCPFCAYGLEKKFKELKGIKKIKINMETGLLTFSYPADKKLNIEKVEKQVSNAGYTPVSVSIERADGSTESSKQEVKEVVIDEDSLIKVEFLVGGNCGMCRARIEKTAKDVTGVTKATWDKKTKMLTLEFDQSQTTQADIETAIAKSGHDTKTARANDEVYKKLPACCHYDRVAQSEDK